MTEAKVSVSWAVRMLIAGAAFVGFGCWSLYDGKIKYPKVEQTFQQYHEAGRSEEWVAFAGEKGWKKEWKKNPQTGQTQIYSEWDIRTQFIMAAICLPIGFFTLTRLILTLPRTLRADEEALHGTDGRRIPYRDMVDIDKRKWDRKGIAVVRYEIDGRRGKAKIDDWIFKDGAAVLAEVERHVNPPADDDPEASALQETNA